MKILINNYQNRYLKTSARQRVFENDLNDPFRKNIGFKKQTHVLNAVYRKT